LVDERQKSVDQDFNVERTKDLLRKLALNLVDKLFKVVHLSVSLGFCFY